MKRVLIIFARQPVPGQAKTRLIPLLGPQGAADLYRHFLLDTLTMARQLPNIGLALAYAPMGAMRFFQELLPDLTLLPQQGSDLGERMDLALRHFLNQGYQQVVLVGSDIPLLSAALVTQAFDRLADGAQLVLGPADDGGYYLIGLTQPRPDLLRSVSMSTPTVLRDTLALASSSGLRADLLPPCYDIDTPADLQRLQADLPTAPPDLAQHTRAYLSLGTRNI